MNPEPIARLANRRAYLLGPMSGIEDHNRPAFRKATKIARRHDVLIISPDELDKHDPILSATGGEPTWAEYLARDLAWVARAEIGLALPGWRDSRGAQLETCILNTLGKEVWEFDVGGRTVTRIDPHTLPVPHFPAA